jgi:hypothetical protein
MSSALRYRIIIHGPEAVDSGLANKLIRLLEKTGQVSAVMSGFTGVAAVIDAGLEEEIDISRRRRPSITLLKMDEEADVLILANSAKNRESALRFVSIVFSRVEGRIQCPLIQVDEGIIVDWTCKSRSLCEMLAEELGYEIVSKPTPASDEAESGWRQIGGVVQGESVWVNGVVVGRATSNQVFISNDEEGHLMARGIEVKPTGVKRLGRFNAMKAHVRSGVVRRTMPARPRSLATQGDRVYLIDHDAESTVYDCRGASLVITVGDDTSRIAGNLLFRFGIPVVAITDGDEDGICAEGLLFPGSIIVRVKPGTDDLVGAEVRSKLFKGEQLIREGITPVEAARAIIEIAGDRFLWQECPLTTE